MLHRFGEWMDQAIKTGNDTRHCPNLFYFKNEIHTEDGFEDTYRKFCGEGKDINDC